MCMSPGVLLLICLLSWYLAAMVIFWYCLQEQTIQAPMSVAVRFALQEGQTIIGVEDTTQGIDFHIGDYVRDENSKMPS